MIVDRKLLSFVIIAVFVASALLVPVHFTSKVNTNSSSVSEISLTGSGSNPGLFSPSNQPVNLMVTFNESGLPSGTTWNVSIAGHVYSSQNSSIVFSLPSGTYNYSVSNNLQYFTVSPIGELNLKTNGQYVSISYLGKFTVSQYLNLENGKLLSSPMELSSNQTVFPVYGVFDNYSKLFLVAGYSSSTVYEINPVDYSIYGQISVPGSPLAIALNQHNGNIYVINTTALLKLSPTGTFLDSVSLTSTPSTLAFDPANGQVLVASTNGGVMAFNASSLSPVAALSSVSVFDIQGFAYNSATGQMEMLDNSGLNSYIDFLSAEDSVTSSVEIPGIALSLVYDPSTNVSVFSTSTINSNSGNAQYAFTLSGSTLTRVSGSENAFGLGIDLQTGMGIATNTQNSTVMLMNLTTDSVVYSVYTGGSPFMPLTIPGSSGMLVIDPSLDAGYVIPLRYSVRTVNFVETGLSGSTSWGLSVNGYTAVSSTNRLLLYEILGNYTYYPIHVPGYTNVPSGHFSVSAGSNIVNVQYNKTFMVQFNESGLPSGQPWSITFNGTKDTSSAGVPVSFFATNGTYSFKVSKIYGYAVSPQNGTLKVEGSEVTVNLNFSMKSYLVNFKTSGLPATSVWNLTIGGIQHTVHGNEYSYVATPGNYTYSIQPVAGYYPVNSSGSFSVNADNITVNIMWKPFLYRTEFTQNILPNGTTWFVNLSNGVSLSSMGPNASAYLQNGSYEYTFTSMNTSWKGYYGNVIVNGNPTVLSLNFTEVIYKVVFSENGLSKGTDWMVSLNNETTGSIDHNLSLQLPNGTYYYVASSLNTSYKTVSGSIEVNGTSLLENLLFVIKDANVTFYETGLPNGTQWGVDILQHSFYNTTGNKLTISLPYGSYSFIPVTIPGFNSTDISRVFSLGSSGNTTIAVSYTPIHPVQKLYNITVMEVGLPEGLDWSAAYNGTVAPAYPGGVFNFQLQNGSYNITFLAINHDGKEMPGSLNATLKVNGTAQDILVVFYGTNVWLVLDFQLHQPAHDYDHHNGNQHHNHEHRKTAEAIRANMKFF